MNVTNIQDYLSHVSTDEITNRLRYIDACLKELHDHGFYVVCNIKNIKIIDDKVTLASFKNQVDYIDSGYNKNGAKQDILELASIGICAYNHFDTFYSSTDFIKNLMNNVNAYINNGKVPRIMRDYYIEVFEYGNVIYLNIYLIETSIAVNAKEIEGGVSKGQAKVKTKFQPGLFNDEKEAAYARVLVIPSILVLVYLVALVCYFIFFR